MSFGEEREKKVLENRATRTKFYSKNNNIIIDLQGSAIYKLSSFGKFSLKQSFNYKVFVIQKLQCKHIYFQCQFKIFALKSIRFPCARTHILNGKWAYCNFSFRGVEQNLNGINQFQVLGEIKLLNQKSLNKENFPDEESLKTAEPWSSNIKISK
ncbi:Hypothetical_protein [Hexamita inflata]|uniref:Hypothetical_protein n=1 Tax=Hexamita inflata TaxID=28002 RepID=A0AA86UJ07_9EUKA|nr:Hypothetical protein HINF_LOCUS45284 [Hexamita inflata]